jgi:predicted GTPase
MTEKAKKEQKAMLKKDFARLYKTSKNKDVNKYTLDLSDMSQARACDILIASMLTSSKSYKDVIRDVIQFIDENDVVMRNYQNNKSAIKKRLIRHATSDTLQRLSKRLTTL